MDEDIFNHFDERVPVLEKDIEILIDMFNEFSQELSELRQKAKAPRWDLLGCKPPPFSFYRGLNL